MKNDKNKQKKEETNKKKKSRFIVILQYIIIFFMVAFNLIFITKAVKNPNKIPDFLGIKTFVIVSGSMEPNINIGDMVIVKVVNEPFKVRRCYSF